MRKLLFLALLSLICILSVGQVVFNYRYWFDGRHEEIHSGVSTDSKWSFEADVSELNVGFHSIYLQVDTSGVFSSPIMKYFFKSLNNNVVTTYWFDGDYKNSQELSTNFVDVSSLSEGIHSISFLANDNGIVSGVTTKWFIKTINCSSDDMTCVCLIDDNEYSRVKVSSSGGLINFDFDVSSLSQGLHKMQLFCITSSGTITDMKESLFLRTPTTEEIQSLKCYYSIDNSSENGYLQAGSYDNGLFHFDIDVSELQDGLHQITCFLANDNGVALGQNTSFFLKTPLGGNGITHWEYWINDSDVAKQTTLDQATSPLQIISLLPIESVPIRSSCFEFKIENDKPVIYAKNDIKFRFFDKSGRMTEFSKQYVDINVSQNLELEKFPKLKTNDVTSITRPTDNEIKWYKFEGEEGELAKFCMDKACGLDVFTPSGEKFYSVSGAESVKEGEDNLPETGTYYVAVHDMTAQYGSSLNLTFTLIDKYAVLEHTPNKSANIGVVDLWLNGNGFDYLKSVRLENEEFSIYADSIIYCNNVIGKAHFDFYKNEAKLGNYDIVIDFNDNIQDSTIVISKGIKIEKPIKGEINVTVETEPIVAYPHPITIRLRNTGNVGYWGIPFNIAYDNTEVFGGMDFTNFSLSFPNDTINHLAPPYVIVDNLVGLGVKGLFMPLVIPYIGPNEEYTLTLDAWVAGNTSFNLYAWAGTPWCEEQQEQLYSIKTTAPKQYSDAQKVQSNLTTAGQMSGLGVSNVREAVGIGATIGGIIITGTYNRENMYRDMGAGVMGDDFDNYRMKYRGSPVSPSSIAENCLPGNSHLNKYVSILFQMAENGTPRPHPNPIEPPASCEPNEMHGYTSESGSTFINGDVTDVFYSIESENDPEIATAAAHTIVVTDTIDGRYHDLSSFAATKVSLGKVSMKLNGEKEFVKTMDLRPLLDVIAQVELKYNESTGIAQWIVTSLDPMTMEPTKNAMQGALPVNDEEGNGIGFFDYDIKLKKGLKDGTEIKNRASIIFDFEEPIITPYWVNTVDTEKPESKVDKIECIDDTTVTLRFKGKDNRSGIWRYKLYVQPGAGSEWYVANENLYQDSCDYKVFRDIDYGFCVVATDSAGNVESKPLEREISYVVYTKGDANGDGIVDSQDIVLAINKYLDENTPINFIAADVNEDDVIDSQDIVAIQNIFLKREDEYYSSTRKRKLIRHNKK